MTPILDAALAWAARGFRVFPVQPGSKVPPKGMSFTTEATTDAAKIEAWWHFEPRYNFGVATGGGLLVVDVDAGKNGYASLLELDLPETTLTVRTPGGGVHLYFTGPDVQNSVDRIAAGIDVRSHNGYVIGPGSFFADEDGKKGYTGPYTIEVDAPVAAAPVEFALRCGEPKVRGERSALAVDEPDDIVFAIHYLLKDAPVAVEGRGGNSTSYAVAARLIEIGVSSGRAAELMLEHWNERCLPPWTKGEIVQFATNAANYAQSRPGAGSVAMLAEQGGDPSDVLPPPAPPSSAGKYDAIFKRRALTPLESIPPRDWIAHRLLMRDEATILAGPGGVGKSGFSLALAAHGAMGQSFAGYTITKPFKTIVYNLEDSRHEMEARLYAACAVYQFDPREIERHIVLWPGREMRFRLLNKDHTVAVADIQEVARLAKREHFDAIILDPLVSLHHEEENDNGAMGEVMDALNGLARVARCAALGLHHTPKAVRQAGSADAVRGAGNIVNSVRIAHTIYAADEHDAALFGFGEGYRAKYVRLDDAKMNNAEMVTKPTWLEKQSFPLPCGDSVQAIRVFEASATASGEAKLIATVLREYMDRAGTLHLHTHDAAKVLTEAEAVFRERVPASGNLSQIKALIEMRLAVPVATDTGTKVVVTTKTEPGESTARRFVTLA